MKVFIKFVPVVSLLLILVACKPQPVAFSFIEGETQGTTYHITYQGNDSIHLQVDSILKRVDECFSLWNSNSLITRINKNDPKAKTDSLFEQFFNKAMQVSQETNGAFDITVGPLVNAYGFGFQNRENIRKGLIDSLRKFIGYQKLKLENGSVIKSDPGILLDPNAIAQGQSVDLVFDFLQKRGIPNFMVEIGGEVRCRGKNPKGEAWRIGVDQPIENSDESNRSLQAVIQLSEKALSTSGNYRKFYEKDGVKYSHTIDPHTGYPVEHNLLSATVVANDCITADAWSTSLMVLGLEKGKEILAKHPEMEAYLIFAAPDGSFKTWNTPGLEKYIRKAE